MICFHSFLEIHRSLQRVLPTRQSGEVLRTSIRGVRRRPLGQDRLHRIPHRHLGVVARRRAPEAPLGLPDVRHEQERQDRQEGDGEDHRSHLRLARRDEPQGRQRPEGPCRCHLHQARPRSQRFAKRAGVRRRMSRRSGLDELFGSQRLNYSI